MNTRAEVLASLKTEDKTGIIPAINEINAKIQKITVSKENPKDTDGKDGDIWIVYEEPVGGGA